MTTLSGDHLEALLAVQEVDTDLDRSHHRLATLPERAELAALDQRRSGLDQQLAAARAERDVVTGRQQALERSLASVEGRAADIKKRLYGGTVSATRELQAMAGEVDSLTARGSELESQVLEVMEEAEPLDARVKTMEGEKGALMANRARVEAQLGVREAEVEAEIESLNAVREEAAARVAADLIATYERLRQRLGGVGAARLVGSRCGGCHLTLAATEIDHMRRQPVGTVNYCEQCGRILVLPHS